MLRSRFIVGLSLGIALAAAAWASAQQRNNASALTALDYAEIHQLYASYNHALDVSDASAFAALFTPDGSLGNATGRDALMETVKRTQQQWKGNWRHLYSNLTIKPQPGGAAGSSFLFAYDVSTKPATITNTGIYVDALVKTSEGWRFKSRTFRNDAPGSR
jgi:hypothetical protein